MLGNHYADCLADLGAATHAVSRVECKQVEDDLAQHAAVQERLFLLLADQIRSGPGLAVEYPSLPPRVRASTLTQLLLRSSHKVSVHSRGFSCSRCHLGCMHTSLREATPFLMSECIPVGMDQVLGRPPAVILQPAPSMFLEVVAAV